MKPETEHRLAALALALLLVACQRPAPPTAQRINMPAITSKSAPPNVLVVAHRGGSALAPENTLAAFDNALKIGVDMVECDVHLSKDGELVVMHDADLARTSDGSGPIGQQTLAELKKLNAAAKFAGGWPSPQPLPTLGELLDRVKGRARVQIEIKVDKASQRYASIEQKVIDAVQARGMVDDVLIISFDLPTLVDIKKRDARFQTGALVNAAWMAARSDRAPEQIVDEIVQATGAGYFLPTASTVSEPLVQAVHARGLKIGVWTVNTAADMQRLAGYGVDAITSDRPDLLKQTLGRRP